MVANIPATPLPAYRGEEPYVFVSYSHEDDALVLPEIAWLQAQGVRVWWDEGITPGAESWRAELATAIRGCATLVYFVTPRSVHSDHCVREVGVALDEYARPVVAVHLEPTALPDSLTLALSGRQAIHRHELGGEAYSKKLAAALGEHIRHGQPFAAARVQPTAKRPGFGWLQLGSALALGLVMGAALFGSGLEGDSTTTVAAGPMTRSYIDLHPDYPLTIGSESHSWSSIALSPDGSHLAYIGKDADGERHVLLSELASPGFDKVEGSQGALSPFFSPDGQWVGYFTDNRVRKAPVAGGGSSTVTTARSPIFAEWVAADDIFVGNYQPDSEVAEVFSWSYTTDVVPGGLLLRTDGGVTSSAANHASVGLLPRTGGELTTLVGPGFHGRLLPGGFLTFARHGELHAARVDLVRGTAGASRRQFEGVGMDGLMGQLHAAASETGTLAFATGGDLSIGRPVWMDRAGNSEPVGLPAAQYNVFHLAPGDRALALQVCDVEDHIVIADLSNGTRHQLAIAPAGWPAWSMDGESLYVSSREGETALLARVELATDRFDVLYRGHGGPTTYFTHVHPHGGGLLEIGPTSGVHHLREGGEPELLIGDGAWGAQFSPDASMVAYVTYDTGSSRVRVRTFPDGTYDVPVSGPETTEPVWCRACDELYFHDLDTVYAVRIARGPNGLEVTPPEPVWHVPNWVDSFGRSYDVSEDGQRLLYIRRERAPERTRIQLVNNWLRQLELLPPVE